MVSSGMEHAARDLGNSLLSIRHFESLGKCRKRA